MTKVYVVKRKDLKARDQKAIIVSIHKTKEGADKRAEDNRKSELYYYIEYTVVEDYLEA